jgi:tetratricopeptide (TPR) repeat protein
MTDKNPLRLKFNLSFVFFLTATLLVVTLYGNTLKVPFIFDDLPNIVENYSLHWNKPLSFSKITQSLISHRPLSNLTFGLNHYFGRLNVKGFHLVNIFFHVANTLLLFHFLKLIFKLGLPAQERNGAGYLAFIISLLWAASPVQTQAVNYIVQRMTLLACLFYLLGLIAYIKALTGHSPSPFYWSVLTFLFGGLALLSKENTSVFPVTCLLIDYLFISKFEWDEFKKHLIKTIPYFAAGGLLGLIFLFNHPEIKDIFLHRSTYQEFTIWERVMTEWRVMIYYLSLLFFPDPNRLSIDYLYPISKNLLEPVTTSASLILIVLVCGWAIKSAKAFPLISFGILWFFINLLVESTIIPIDLVFEHRLYLPSIGFFISLGSIIHIFLFKRKTLILQNIGLIFFLLALSLEALYTFERNNQWTSEIGIWKQVVNRFPDLPRAHLNLGNAYEKENDLSQTEKEYSKAIELRPEDSVIHNNFGAVLWKKGDLEKATFEFKRAVLLNPENVTAHLNLAKLYGQSGNPALGMIEINQVLINQPLNEMAYINLGELFEAQEKWTEAQEVYLKAIKINPSSVDAYSHIGILLIKKDNFIDAEKYYQQGLSQNPETDILHQGLGLIYQNQGFLDKGLTEFIKAAALNPNNPTVHYNIGATFLQKGDLELAVSEFERAMMIAPKKEALSLFNEAFQTTQNASLKSRLEKLIKQISK